MSWKKKNHDEQHTRILNKEISSPGISTQPDSSKSAKSSLCEINHHNIFPFRFKFRSKKITGQMTTDEWSTFPSLSHAHLHWLHILIMDIQELVWFCRIMLVGDASEGDLASTAKTGLCKNPQRWLPGKFVSWKEIFSPKNVYSKIYNSLK